MPTFGEMIAKKKSLADIAQERQVKVRIPGKEAFLSASHYNEGQELEYQVTKYIELRSDERGSSAIYCVEDKEGMIWRLGLSEHMLTAIYTKFGIKEFEDLEGKKLRLVITMRNAKKYFAVSSIYV